MLGGRVKKLEGGKVKPLTTKTRRTVGTTLQNRRKRLWTADPHCAGCGRVVPYPHGFELDHIVPLWQGGPDEEGNCQILCVWTDEVGEKRGCHAEKSAEEAAGRTW